MALAVVVMTAPTAATASDTAATAGAFGFAVEQPTQTLAWPSFTDVLDKADAPLPAYTAFDATPSMPTTMVSAPLPPAALTGLFLLAGNCVLTHLWKKRKI